MARPLDPADRPGESASALARGVRRPEHEAGSARVLLLVEDERLVRTSLDLELRDLGYDVLMASNGHEALSAARAQTGGIDLLLTDIVMPGMSGTELARRLRVEQPGLPALFMSAFPTEVLVEEGRLERGQRALEKPFEIAELDARIRALLPRGPRH